MRWTQEQLNERLKANPSLARVNQAGGGAPNPEPEPALPPPPAVKAPRKDKGVKRPRHLQTCQQCQQRFHAANSAKRKFCSRACTYANKDRIESAAAKLRKSRPVRVCKNCSKEFKVHRTAAEAVFCCQPCAAAHLTSHRIAQ